MRLGEYNIKTDPDCMNGVCAPRIDVDIEDYICHSQFNPASFHNDICLLRLVKPVEFTGKVFSSICYSRYQIGVFPKPFQEEKIF